jgi:hypothetical protein
MNLTIAHVDRKFIAPDMDDCSHDSDLTLSVISVHTKYLHDWQFKASKPHNHTCMFIL